MNAKLQEYKLLTKRLPEELICKTVTIDLLSYLNNG